MPAADVSSINPEIQEVFRYFDRDLDGYLDVSELGIALRSFGLCPSQAEIKQLEKELGSKINLDIFKKAASRFSNKNKNTEEEIREALRVFDKEGLGKIDVFELKHAMTSLGEPLKDEEVDELIREIHVDPDGRCFLEDIVSVLANKK